MVRSEAGASGRYGWLEPSHARHRRLARPIPVTGTARDAGALRHGERCAARRRFRAPRPSQRPTRAPRFRICKGVSMPTRHGCFCKFGGKRMRRASLTIHFQNPEQQSIGSPWASHFASRSGLPCPWSFAGAPAESARRGRCAGEPRCRCALGAASPGGRGGSGPWASRLGGATAPSASRTSQN